MSTLGKMLLIFVAAICSVDSVASEPVQFAHAAQAWMGLLCSGATQDKNKLLLVADKLLENPHAKTICVDRGVPSLDYQANALRIEIYKKLDAFGVRLKCASEQGAHQFYRDNLGKRVAFVVGNKVLGIYSVAEPNMGCGWYQAGSIEQATKQCKVIARAWGVDASACSKQCVARGSHTSQSICVGGG
ncbi:MAG: hypothetical protein JSR26_13265 [Proteobacteria bacterium]|nr:hypothetical protein [Pseudomonadota bacterium]